VKTRLVDPTLTGPASTRRRLQAPRLRTLDGAVIGLLANGKTNAMPLLDAVLERLEATHDIERVIRFTKEGPNASGTPIPDGPLAMMAEHCLAIISAVGD
jgi:hypothetical protein